MEDELPTGLSKLSYSSLSSPSEDGEEVNVSPKLRAEMERRVGYPE